MHIRPSVLVATRRKKNRKIMQALRKRCVDFAVYCPRNIRSMTWHSYHLVVVFEKGLERN